MSTSYSLGVRTSHLRHLWNTGSPIPSHVIPMTNVYREDQVGQSLTPEEVVANAPDAAEEFFKVPRIVEE